MSVYWTPRKSITVDTSIYATGDAMGSVTKFTNIPDHGVIHAIVASDASNQKVNFDVCFFTWVGGAPGQGAVAAPLADTSVNGAFAPSTAELNRSIGSVLMSTFKAYSANAEAVTTNIGLPYWAPTGNIWIQCVTRGTPTYTAATDVQIMFAIVT